MLSNQPLYYHYSTKKSIVKQTIKNNKKQKYYLALCELLIIS